MVTNRDLSKPNVLIIGAGPIGLTLGNELARHGIHYRIIDRSPNASDKTKALGIMARTLELFEKMGVAETFISLGHKAFGFNLFSQGKQLAKFDFNHLIQSPYPYVLMVPQNITEAILNEHLAKHGIGVEREVELVSFTQQENEIAAILRHADGSEERVQTQWLIGCDGAHSTVRHALGIEFAGTTFEQSFALADIHIDWSLANDQIYAFLHKGDFIAYFPMDGGQRHRVIIAHQSHTEPSGDVTLEEVQRIIDTCGPQGARASDPSWLARFRINQRKVKRYKHGRAILAGDAAHIHSPIGAQGMNTGIQDAFNLAWKLALVLTGRAPETLLESYDAEREPVGKALVQGTDRFTRIALLDHTLPVAVRDHVAPFVFSLPMTQHRLADAISEIALAYRQSPIVHQEQAGVLNRLLHLEKLSAGDRAPDGLLLADQGSSQQRLFEMLHGTRHVLLVFSGLSSSGSGRNKWQEIYGIIAKGYTDVVDAYRIVANERTQQQEGTDGILDDPDGNLHQLYGFQDGGLVLIRPDGYIGFLSRTGSVEGLISYLEKLFNS